MFGFLSSFLCVWLLDFVIDVGGVFLVFPASIREIFCPREGAVAMRSKAVSFLRGFACTSQQQRTKLLLLAMNLPMTTHIHPAAR